MCKIRQHTESVDGSDAIPPPRSATTSGFLTPPGYRTAHGTTSWRAGDVYVCNKTHMILS